MTRFLYKVIDSRHSWDSRFNIGPHNDCLSEIFFWKSNIVSLNSRPILPYQAPFLLSFSDASNVACGAYLVGTNEVSHRMWSPCEVAKGSTWKELKAVHFALTSFKEFVEGKSVKWHSDNQGAVRIVEIGSPNSELHSIALDIFDFCRKFNVTFVPQWVPRELNACADEISNVIDFDDSCTTQGCLHIQIVSGALILLIDLQMHPMPIFPGLILGFVYRVPKLLMHFQSNGLERIIGWFRQCTASFRLYNTSLCAALWGL